MELLCLLDHLLFGCFCRQLRLLINLRFVTGSKDNSSAYALACSYVSSHWWGFVYLCSESLTHTPLSGVSMWFPPQRISPFNLGFVTLKRPFIFLRHSFFFFFTWLLATLSAHAVFCCFFLPLIFLHNTSHTGGSQACRNTDRNWMKCRAPGRTWAGWKDCERNARQSLR